MKHGSLFSGIGGFDLASEWMGWENVFHCEWNPFGQQVLKHYWPKAISYENICKTDFNVHRGNIDILTGGFPCQPYSTAGKRLGKEDERHLFPEMLRAIKEIQPRWIVGENVRGLVSWNGGMVFHEVHDDLEREGYEVQSFLIPAASVNAPHRRDRIWFVAKNTKCNGFVQREFEQEGTEVWQQRNISSRSSDGIHILQGNITDTSSIGQQCRKERELTKTRTQSNDEQFERCDKLPRENFKMFPSVSSICNGNDGLSDRLDGITFSKWRKESIKGGGNAIVPQVALQIFRTIQAFESCKLN